MYYTKDRDRPRKLLVDRKLKRDTSIVHTDDM